MAITLNAAADGAKGATGTTLTVPVTVVAGSNRCAYVGITTGGNGVLVTSVTYSGTSDAIEELYDAVGGTTSRQIALYRILNPQVGTFDVVVTIASAVPATASVLVFAGVDQSTPNDSVATADEEATASSLSVATAVNDMVIAYCEAQTENAFSALDGQTTATDEANAADANRLVGGYLLGTGASQTMRWSWGAMEGSRSVGVSLNPAAEGGPPLLPFRTTIGAMRVR